MKILITGGHLTPALALIDEIIAQKLPWTIIFAGRDVAQVENNQASYEAAEVKKRGLSFIDFAAVKTGSFNLKKFCQSVKNARQILREKKIDVVMSFGGYLALPFALAARGERIPIITHEQTRVLGSANRLIARLADQVAISFPDTKVRPARKAVFTGNPLRQEIFDSHAQQPTWFQSDTSKPWLYISGGSQGSKIINENIAPIMSVLLENFVVIHQVGAASNQRNPRAELEDFYRAGAPLPNRTNYYLREFLSASELAFFYPRLSLAVARAGANTVAELSAFRIPTLYIPLPFANRQEQALNAAYQEKIGLALVLPQAQLTPATLLTQIENLTSQATQMRKTQLKIEDNLSAAKQLINLIKNIYAQSQEQK